MPARRDGRSAGAAQRIAIPLVEPNHCSFSQPREEFCLLSPGKAPAARNSPALGGITLTTPTDRLPSDEEAPEPKRRSGVADLLSVCAVFDLSFAIAASALVQAIPAEYRAVVNWYGLPVLFVLTGLVLARATGIQRSIRLVGSDLTLSNSLPFVAAAVLIPTISTLAILWFGRALLPGITQHVAHGIVLSGPMFRSLIGSPVGEEVLFRGWLLSWLASRDDSRYVVFGCTLSLANLLTALAFAAVHLMNGIAWYTPISLLSVFAVALALGRAKERTGGLLLPMVCHFLTNFVSNVVF